ncbi:hypothetical protein E4656_14925 [Natronospirillum operosum]|uniref:DUF1127 domain-containing protein n=1 Tax=Natronospirillum operosum TaxID=2759953 RepID=A0A4Z0W958_9GAMM|nr:hypothetical protein [Natronospirillum operosum]TGG91687.1 hypothetical protein E4656_14925 [Natronospirillum operosum]
MNQYQPLQHEASQDDNAPTPPTRLALYMPATPPLGLIHALELWWWRYRRRRQFRQRFQPLLAYDDHMLEDMGHRRSDIQWALGLPLQVDALKALQERRARYKR